MTLCYAYMKKTSADLPGAEATAKQVIIAHHVQSPPVPVAKFFQQDDFSIYSAEFSEQIIIAGFIDMDKHQIILNEMDDPEVQTVTLARALGHWIMHRDELEEIPELKVIYHLSLGGDLKNFYEKEAIHFALHLLLPEYFIVDDLKLDNETIASKYQVPDFLVAMIRKEYDS